MSFARLVTVSRRDQKGISRYRDLPARAGHEANWLNRLRRPRRACIPTIITSFIMAKTWIILVNQKFQAPGPSFLVNTMGRDRIAELKKKVKKMRRNTVTLKTAAHIVRQP
jgi:hypothetical protein